MIYIGMDVSSKSFVIHAIDARKKVVCREEIPPCKESLLGLLQRLGKERKLVVFEAGNQMKWIAQTLMKVEGVELHVVHPNELKWISQSSGKTDKVDARKMAELAKGDLLPRKVHIVEGHIRQLREMLSGRQVLQSKRIALINGIRAMMLQEGVRLPEKFFDRLDWRERLEKAPVSEATRKIITAYMHGICGLQAAEDDLTEQIVAIKDDRLKQLESIPGIGSLSSRILLGALDDASRFDNKKSAAKYGALTPTVHQSGNVNHHGHICRDGRHEIRKVLLQCAHTVARMKRYDAKPLKEFFERIQKRRGKKIAVVALARKLLTIAYGVLKAGTYYDPSRLSLREA
ncbi:MAG TPA: IS110 family transposase [Geobacteraceae bacterium]|nr:IS110 family transposase [Geobacteraceae bacterium]